LKKNKKKKNKQKNVFKNHQPKILSPKELIIFNNDTVEARNNDVYLIEKIEQNEMDVEMEELISTFHKKTDIHIPKNISFGRRAKK
jgi:hypothetical protein